MKQNWVPTMGKFEINEKQITFMGESTEYTDNISGQKRVGLAYGQILSNQYFSEGEISAEVVFEDVSPGTVGEIIFYYDPENEDTYGAGITGTADMYGLRSYINKKFDFFKLIGNRSNFKAGRTYLLKISLKGSQLKFKADGIELFVFTLPSPLKRSQVGFFCGSNKKVTIKNYSVKAEKPKVFMIMQFSDQYDEVYEEVIREVCSDESYDLQVLKADEIYGPGIILADIIKNIYESKVVIAEISQLNANVFYEVGYAHALKKPTILLAEKGTNLPFDVSPFRVIFYQNTIAGKKKVQESLKKNLDSILNQ